MDVVLEKLISDLSYEELPDTWALHNFINFSESKDMYDYQIDGLKNTIKALYFYYDQYVDFTEKETPYTNIRRKKTLMDKYGTKGIQDNSFDFKNNKRNKSLFDIYSHYLDIKEETIPSYNFINRMSYWMATGSGKSLVIIKLFSVLDNLIKNKEIPENDLLFLAPTNDLINQTKALVREYNKMPGNRYIEFIDLRDFNEYKANNRLNLGEIPVFYYRSDLISDETKESIINYYEYDNNGRWYIFLDEAHKGDKGDSKRQAYYTCMARNGFQFNFSATFTEDIDVVTTVKDFNLSNFIKAGYGKNIFVSNSQYHTFNSKERNDFSNDEKQLIVIKSLIMLTYVKKNKIHLHKIKSGLYHSPLMVTLVNSVNKTKSDLLLFFKEIEKIASGNYQTEIFEQAKQDLLDELKGGPSYEFNNGRLDLMENMLAEIAIKDVLEEVYNSKTHGSIEVITTKDNKELAFKLKSSDISPSPFALIKIGDVTPWIRNNLRGYEFIKTFADKKYFSELNNHPDINILLGSRAFYEGWDSSRPNIINYINIGSSTDAKKYVMQSMGRGVRIEPIKDERKRLSHLYNLGKVDHTLYENSKKFTKALESLFVFATNKHAIKEIIEGLNEGNEEAEEKEIKLNKNSDNKPLIIPVYKKVKFVELPTFKLSQNSFARLKKYLFHIPDTVLALQYFIRPSEITTLRKIGNGELQDVIEYDDAFEYRDLILLTQRLVRHIRLEEKELAGFKPVDREISHFEKIKVNIDHYDLIKEKIEDVTDATRNTYTKNQLLELHTNGHITLEEYTELLLNNVKSTSKKGLKYRDLVIKQVAESYYNPLIYSENENIDYIKHIIKVKSEVLFMKDLEKYLSKQNNKAANLDWWKFSNIDEHLDNLYIPYYSNNQLKKYKPDFIFWLNKGRKMKLVFVDPKGTQHTSYQKKVDGYRKIFENKQLQYNEYDLSVELKLYTKDDVTGLYRQYWFNNMDDLFEI